MEKGIQAHWTLPSSTPDKLLLELYRKCVRNIFFLVISDHELYTKNARDIENDLKALIPEKNKELTKGTFLALNGTAQTSCDILSSEVQGHLQKEEIIVIIRRVTMGMGSRNPIEKVRTKNNT